MPGGRWPGGRFAGLAVGVCLSDTAGMARHLHMVGGYSQNVFLPLMADGDESPSTRTPGWLGQEKKNIHAPPFADVNKGLRPRRGLLYFSKNMSRPRDQMLADYARKKYLLNVNDA